ncbi:flagellar protein FlaG [Ornithinibacillus sp. 4-3]|uniref:Flagellar protein FlaG n=1 Tax=Ornithinibacillus sp. 4-3 TaxID=3231488 RepID=A0AB39HP72_9BACI
MKIENTSTQLFFYQTSLSVQAHNSNTKVLEDVYYKANVDPKENKNELDIKAKDSSNETFSSLQFKYHEELNEYYVAVIDPLTNEIIKEIPPKNMLDKYAVRVKYIGLLVDKRA